MPPQPRPVLDRMEPMTAYEPNTGCWLWLGAVDKNGYGKVSIKRSVWQFTHIVTWEAEHGPVPDGLQLDHLCRVHHCRSPYHLEPVTVRTNLERGMSPAWVSHRLGVCKRGHPLEDPNLYYDRHGRRYCKQCFAVRRGRLP